jgi:hypothetical protein
MQPKQERLVVEQVLVVLVVEMHERCRRGPRSCRRGLLLLVMHRLLFRRHKDLLRCLAFPAPATARCLVHHLDDFQHVLLARRAFRLGLGRGGEG